MVYRAVDQGVVDGPPCKSFIPKRRGVEVVVPQLYSLLRHIDSCFGGGGAGIKHELQAPEPGQTANGAIQANLGGAASFVPGPSGSHNVVRAGLNAAAPSCWMGQLRCRSSRQLRLGREQRNACRSRTPSGVEVLSEKRASKVRFGTLQRSTRKANASSVTPR